MNPQKEAIIMYLIDPTHMCRIIVKFPRAQLVLTHEQSEVVRMCAHLKSRKKSLVTV